MRRSWSTRRPTEALEPASHFFTSSNAQRLASPLLSIDDACECDVPAKIKDRSELSTGLWDGCRLARKVALTTGAASGIGKATTTEFIKKGVRVILIDIKDNAGRTIAADLDPCASYTRCNRRGAGRCGRGPRHGRRADGPEHCGLGCGREEKKGKNGGTHVRRGEGRASRNGGSESEFGGV